MLKRIHVKGYKSLRDVELRLPRLVVLFGPNLAGKSNFLDALQLVSRLGTSRSLVEAFDPPCRGKPLESFTIGKEGTRGLLDQERLSFSMEVDLCLSDGAVEAVNRQIREMGYADGANATDTSDESVPAVRERDLRYRVVIEMQPKSGVLYVADEYLAALNPNGYLRREQEPFIERQEQTVRLRSERQGPSVYLNRFSDRCLLSMPHHPPHFPHAVAARCELERWLFHYFEPHERMRSSTPVRETHHIGFTGENLAAFLNTLKALNPRQYAGIEQALHVFMPDISGIEIEVNDWGEVELRFNEDGVTFPARLLSEGALRILGLLALSGSTEPPALVGFEEPETGIHPRRLELIAEFLKTREHLRQTQYIVTTHSPVLPDLLADEFLFAVRRLNGQTRIDPFTAWGPLGYQESSREAPVDGMERLPFAERILRGDFDV